MNHTDPTPPEAGNIFFKEDDDFGPPFTRGEKVFLTLLIMAYVALLAWIVTSVGEYAIERFFTTH